MHLAENTKCHPDNYNDNFGFYSVGDDPDEPDFLHYIKLASVRKLCVRCNQIVYLQPQKEMCATCAEAVAYGAPPRLEAYLAEVSCQHGSSPACLASFYNTCSIQTSSAPFAVYLMRT